jgi:hypothetical protein
MHINHIEPKNGTQITEFLLGISEDPRLLPILFELFLSIVLVTILESKQITQATISDSNLHTTMYFFYSNLSSVDKFVIFTIIPNVLLNIQSQTKAIT